MRPGLKAGSIQVAFVLAMLALWFAVTSLGALHPLLLPEPGKVWAQMQRIAVSGALWKSAQVTFYEIIVAYVLAAVPGLLIGFAVSRTRWATRFFEPIFAGVFTVPLVLFFPLFIFFFGIGPNAKIAFGAVYAFFPVVLSAIAAFAGVDTLYVRGARSMGASARQLFFKIYLPGALPGILNGLRIGSVICISSVLGGETISAANGLGHSIALAGEMLNSAQMYAWVCYVVVIVVVINKSLSGIEAAAQRRTRLGI
jgi:ABC-type nitrate/sulfonate/bicarbonate transport system permease component